MLVQVHGDSEPLHLAEMLEIVVQASPFFDKLVFSKIKQRLGGRVRAGISGAAPLSPHVEEFLAVALCCHFSQGYGLTETCGSSFLASGNAVSPSFLNGLNLHFIIVFASLQMK